MGCLLELLLEIVVEGTLELVMYCYMKLMQLIIPHKTVTDKAKKAIKTIVTTAAALWLIVLIVGAILLVQDDLSVKEIGKYMTYIPLTVIALQILLGIIMKIINRIKR